MNILSNGYAMPAWGWMWTIAIALYAMAKGLTWLVRQPSEAPTWKHVLYLVAWPGMDVDSFLNNPGRAVSNAEWTFALAKLAAGLSILFFLVPAFSGANLYLVGWIGMTGIVVALHFGVFHVLSCVCRTLGADAPPLMNWPVLSQSLTEFWSKRWNLAFRDLTYRFVFRPLVGFLGPAAALVAGFLMSGVVHDLVISVPAGRGYGLPTCYFAIQAAALLFEGSRWGRSAGLGRGTRGRLYCLVVLVGPSLLLFHPPFVHNVIVPFLRALGLIQ